ncbi:TMV resistance protein N isoform X2 [Populus alba]|nr:disease resistance protein RPV1-like [Populus alba]
MTEPESSKSRTEGAYDVFLSFRGEDTRKKFIDHLYTALVQAGIHTFRDDNELPRGEEISDHLLKAIQESKISIVVFSKGYASSRWCLNELVEILECKNRKTGQIALPIFYDIDPSDVRKQTGSFSEAFDKHEKRYKEKVKEWRKALEDAGNLSGWNLNDMENGHEAKFIQKIIKDVLNKLDPKHLNIPKLLVRTDPLAHNIFDFLSTATDDVRIVGIHGMPGIGKTTIAKVLFNQLCYGFEGSCFLSNINETSRPFNGLALLQKQLLHAILKQDAANISNVDRGMVLIKERLCRKRVLVVADDVSHLDQLNALMGERSWFGPGSRVIITTRDSSFLLKADQTYRIEELKPDESLQLFSWHAFKDTKPVEDYIELSKDAVDYCGGLPLALEVIGACLSGKNKDRWKSVIDKLRRIPNRDIQGKLRISFDGLDDDGLQNAFLDIACFFIGRKKEYVEKVLEARCGYDPEVDLGTLCERSLIKVTAIGKITMHDLLRDMGREIIREKSPKQPGARNRIWNQEDAWNVLDQQKGTEVVEGLALDVRASEAKSLNTGSFAKMRCLNLLQINGVHLTGSFKLLSKVLMWICWFECPLQYLPFDFTLDNLVVLDMQYSKLRELWKGKKILNKLKILNLNHSQFLVKTPNLHSSSLQKLRLEGCSSLVEVHQSIGNLKSLIFLNLKRCRSLKILPESIGDVKSLKRLNISGCSQLEKLPECMGDMESLTELLADGIKNELLPSFVHLKYVRKLSLCGYIFCRDSPSPTSWVSQISSWLSLSSTSWPLPVLSLIIASTVLNRKHLLPTSFEWRSLKCLKFSNSGLSDRTTNCVDFRGLSSLKELDLSQNNFSSLPSGIGFLPKLSMLSVRECIKLVSISDLPSNLDCLNAFRCSSMKSVRIPIQSKNSPFMVLEKCYMLEEIQGIEDPSNNYWTIDVDFPSDSSNNFLKSLAEASCNGDYGYYIGSFPGNMPNWLSYRGEGCSLSFHIPPVFQGLVVWVVSPFDVHSTVNHTIGYQVIIKNKNNGVQLFEDKIIVVCSYPRKWVRYISTSDMAMEEYCGDEELELYLASRSSDRSKGVQCGIHVIAEETDSFEGSEWDREINNIESRDEELELHLNSGRKDINVTECEVHVIKELEVGRDRVMPASRPYRLLPHHPNYGLIRASTTAQWKAYLMQKKYRKVLIFGKGTRTTA